MHVLHYIDHVRNEDFLSQYLTILTSTQEQLGAKVSVVTLHDNIEEKIDKLHPQIVHVHTLWSWHAARVVRLARKHNSGILITPHGQLDAYRCRHERMWWKQTMTIAYQRSMIACADAIQASSQRESKRLTKLGWNDQTDIIGCALLNSHLTSQDMGRLSLQLYRKIIDSRYRHYLTEEDDKVVGLLLHAAIDEDPSAALTEEQIGHIHALDEERWRRITLWAYDEDVMPLVMKAAHRLGMIVLQENQEPSTINRYPVRFPKQRGELPYKELTFSTESAKDKWKTILEGEDETLQKVITLILNARTLHRQHKLSLRHLCDLYVAIKFLDYDEDQLKNLLPRFAALSFARKIISLLAQRLLLTEGFMPLRPGKKVYQLNAV